MVKLKHPVGYQVEDAKSNHPKDMCSYEIYPLDVCLREQKKDIKRWRLLPVWPGDIEDPLFMLKKGKGLDE